MQYYKEENILKLAVVSQQPGSRSYTETQRKQMHVLAKHTLCGSRSPYCSTPC
ncbi:hypothetical protein [Deinococcus deserti]|uniref:hypothetical protein n=1 Tax=Deinococcus deserti TaxID=310783 RepID=UPI0039EB6995